MGLRGGWHESFRAIVSCMNLVLLQLSRNEVNAESTVSRRSVLIQLRKFLSPGRTLSTRCPNLPAGILAAMAIRLHPESSAWIRKSTRRVCSRVSAKGPSVTSRLPIAPSGPLCCRGTLGAAAPMPRNFPGGGQFVPSTPVDSWVNRPSSLALAGRPFLVRIKSTTCIAILDLHW